MDGWMDLHYAYMNSCVCMKIKTKQKLVYTPESELQKCIRQDTECVNTFQLKCS